MKLIKKYLYIFFCSIALLLLAAYASTQNQTSLPSFFIQNPNEAASEEVSIFDAKDRNFYVFLPSYADMEHVTVSLATKKEISIGNVLLYDGIDCGTFDLEIPYPFSINGQQIATLWFYQSENVATMYIDTATGSMEYIHKDKNHEENASITLYTADGEINYSDEKSILKGRGNTTWGRDKRPYSLALPSDGNLLDMGEATNWVLLANAHDETNLRNKLVLDAASHVGIEWTPESRWVDIYLNGEYAGLYLLTEKVEIHKNRLDIDTAAGDFLCNVEINNRWARLKHPFLSAAGRTIEISAPETITEIQSDTIEQLVNQMELELFSGSDLRSSAIFDLDSWVYRYLIDEIFGNVDSDKASSYFYFSNGTFFAGPVWDYDLSMGSSIYNQNPCMFITRKHTNSDAIPSSYYSALYANESFYSRMKELYLTEFKPLIKQIIDQEIDYLTGHISNAAQMNSLRWREMYDVVQSLEPGTVHTPMGIKEYLSRRIDFLDSAWLDNTNYCTVRFELSPGAEYWNISIKQGSCLETTYVDIASTTWINISTGQVVDFSQPIMADMVLTRKQNETSSSDAPDHPLASRDYITFLSITVLLVLLIGFVIVDAIHRHKERRSANEHSKTKASS